MAKAVVIGGGFTGMATAMLLAERDFDVIVLDRDPAPPDTPEAACESWSRRSVTQFHQVHFLQPRGRALLEEHLPSVAKELAAAGAVRFNFIAELSRLLPTGPDSVDFEQFETLTTCRRPVIELAFVKAAQATPTVDIRNGVVVTELVTGPAVIDGVPHIVGVRTEAGDTLTADVVIDAGGRRSPVAGLLEVARARRPEESTEEVGFTYSTRYYRGGALPEVRDDVNASVGSITILTMPGDRGHWSVTLYHSPHDKPMRKVRDPKVFERVVRALPHHAHWVDGEPVTDVLSMTSTANTRRAFVIDGSPVATGIVPVGDAWGFTNPSIGRGISLGLIHTVDVAAVVADNVADPAALTEAWQRVTEEQAAPWHDATVQFDRIRGPEVEAFRQGLPDPHDPNDMAVAGFRAFDCARHCDPQVLQWWGEQATCFTLPSDLIARDGVLGRVIEVATRNEPYRVPGPDRAELEALLV